MYLVIADFLANFAAKFTNVSVRFFQNWQFYFFSTLASRSRCHIAVEIGGPAGETRALARDGKMY